MEKYNNILRSMLKCSSSFLGNTKLGFMALLWGLLLSGWATNAQGYPVQIIPQVTPPPPIYLSEYADASVTNGPLRVQLLLNDFSISNREVRLRMYFEGNGLSFQSNPIVNGAAPLFLEGGVPLVLTQTDLAPYFQFENISGVSGNAYGKVLAEGSYSVCYEVIDVLTGNALSARTCAAAIVFQNEPPLLVMPYNRAHVEEKNPQNIVFQWTPRHLNVTNVEYQLDIVEVWDNQVDPQQAFLSSPPVFTVTTNSTTYVYGPADPLLLSGKRYAWRVTAKALQGTEEIGLFKNQGHSEIYSFSYAGECGLPEGVTYEVKGKSNVNLYWTDLSTEVPEYTIRYRKKEGENNEWFYSKTTSNTTTLWDLTAGTTYEYQIAKSCGIVVSDFTPVDEFTTATENEEDSLYECGIDPNFSVENTNPLASLSPGDSFVAGDFPVTVETASGSNGRFTGTGFVRIPYLRNLKVAVEFTNVLVNTDSQLAEGSVRTVYDYENSSILDIDEVIDTVDTLAEQVGEFFEGDNDLDEITVNFPIPDTTAITVVDGNVVITNPANGATVTEPLGDDMVVTDSEGNVYHVDAAGNVTKGGIKDSGGIVNADNVSGVNNRGEIESLTAPGIKVTFNTKGTFGMDLMPSGANAALREEYTIIEDYEGQDYVLTHHAVKKGADTQILASIAVTGNDYTAEDLIFKTKQGETVTKDVVDGKTYLKLTGHYTLESETIYAVVTSKQDTTKQLTAGAFTLWHLTERSVDVALVAVNNAPLDNYQETIDQIFDQGVAQVNFASPLQISINAEELGGSLDVGDSPFAAAYNAEQKMLINKVKNHPEYNRDTYYILVFNDIPAATGIAGFMPLQRQFGFVFSGSGEEEGKDGDKGKVLAHEMGHGIFALQHPFAAYGNDMENATDWLMDYNSGTGLPHMHWAQIHNPDLKFYTFQDEEDGESATVKFRPNKEFTIVDNNDKSYYRFLTFTGEALFIDYDEFVSVSFYFGMTNDNYENLIPGTLLNYTVKEKSGKKVKYTLKFSEAGEFLGYLNENNESNVHVPNVDNNHVMIGYPSPYGGQKGYTLALHEFRGVEDYTASNLEVKIVEDIDFYPNYQNQAYAENFSDHLLVGEEQNDITEEYRSTLKGSENGKEYLIVLKIAEWRSRYPIWFNQFTTTFNDWNLTNLELRSTVTNNTTMVPVESTVYNGIWNAKMAEDNNRLYNMYENSNTKYEFYKEFLREFKSFAINESNLNRECIENLAHNYQNMENAAIFSCLNAASQDELKQFISQDARQNIIAHLLRDVWVDDYVEQQIVKLLTYTPNNFNPDTFFDFLENTCEIKVRKMRNNGKTITSTKCLWVTLFRKVNDAFIFGKDNRKALLRIFLEQFKTSNRYSEGFERYANDLEGSLIKNNTYVFDYENILVRLFSGGYASLNTKIVTENNKNLIDVEQLNLEDNKNHASYNPFDLVFILNKSRLDKGNSFKAIDENGKPSSFMAPAILLLYLDVAATNQTTEDVIITTIDLASLAATGTPASQLAKVFIYADKISSVTSIAGTAFREENPELSSVFNTASAVMGVASMGDMLLNTQVIRTKTQIEAINEVNDLAETIINYDNIEGIAALKKLEVSAQDDGVGALINLMETSKHSLDIEDASIIQKIDNSIGVLQKVKRGETAAQTATTAESLTTIRGLLTTARASGDILSRFESLESISSIANRFTHGNKTGLDALETLLSSVNDNQKLAIVQELINADNVFTSTIPVTFKVISSGSAKIVTVNSPNGELVARVINGSFTRRTIQIEGDIIANLDNIEIVKNGDRIGFRGSPDWPYNPNAVYRDKTISQNPLNTEGSYKDIYTIPSEPDKVMALLRGSNVTDLANELDALKRLEDMDIPVVEVYEKLYHGNTPAYVMKKYAQGSDDIAVYNYGAVEIRGTSDLLNQNSITSLEHIKTKLMANNVEVEDLEFLIANDGSFVIADPLGITTNAAVTANSKNIVLIDALIEQAKLAVNGGGNLTTSFKNITGITDATANSLAAKNKAADILNLLEAKASVNGFPVQKLADDLANGTDDFIDAMLDADDTFFRVWKQVVDKNVSSNISTNKAFIDKLKSLCN